MWKKFAAIIVFLLIVVLTPLYVVLKDEPDIEHYSPFGDEDNRHHLNLLTEAIDAKDGTAAEYEVKTIVSSPVILRGIKNPEQTCYVVVGVDRDYRDEEIETVEHFVKEDGGKAIILDDFGSPNALSEKFGVFFYGKPLWDDINMTGPNEVKNISFPTFEAKLGLQKFQIVMNAPTGLTTYNPNVEYIANGSEKSYVDLDGNGRINIGDKKGNIPVVLEIKYNASGGRIVFISDADLVTDNMIRQEKAKQNKAFFITLVNRLMERKDGILLFDESRHQHQPSQELLYKNVETITVMTSWIWPILMSISAMLVIFGLVVYSARDKDSWIHRFDVSAFSRRTNPPERIKEQAERARQALMEKVRMMYSYSVEEMSSIGPDQIRAMVKENDLIELWLNPQRGWTQQELRVLIQRIKEWGGD